MKIGGFLPPTGWGAFVANDILMIGEVPSDAQVNFLGVYTAKRRSGLQLPVGGPAARVEAWDTYGCGVDETMPPTYNEIAT